MLVATKRGRVGIYNEGIPHTTLWSRGFARSSEILDLLYLYCNMVYAHQTWQGGDLLWEASIHKITQPFEDVVTWSHRNV